MGSAILTLLLQMSKEPIIIDQPEDDLDTKNITDFIVKGINEKKQSQQIIVVTHNPNIVVNTNSEQVIHMEFAGGEINASHSGALQDFEIRDASSKVANDILVKSLLDKNIMSGYSVIECDIVEFLENEKNESFDIVLAMHIISHGTIDIIASSYIKNIYRVLKKNGIACITLPSITDERCPNHGADIYEYVF